jgi:hypothetical protein
MIDSNDKMYLFQLEYHLVKTILKFHKKSKVDKVGYKANSNVWFYWLLYCESLVSDKN